MSKLKSKNLKKRECPFRATWETRRNEHTHGAKKCGIERFFIFVIFLFSFFFLSLSRANAQETLPLVISPAKQEFTVSPSEKKILEITLFNKGTEPISGVFKVSNFVVTDAQGTPKLVEENSNSKYSAKNWVTVSPEEGIINPREKVTISVSIQVPQNVRPGGHYVAVYFQPTFSRKEDSSNISVRIVSLMNIKVLGDIKESAQLSSVRVPGFLEFGPVETNFSITNSGDYHIIPEGTVILINMFDTAVDRSSIERRNIFPEATREYKTPLGKGFLIGPYKIRLAITYGERAKSLSKTQTVFVFPWRLFLILIVGLTILYYMSGALRKKDKHNDFLEKNLEDDILALKEKLNKRND